MRASGSGRSVPPVEANKRPRLQIALIFVSVMVAFTMASVPLFLFVVFLTDEVWDEPDGGGSNWTLTNLILVRHEGGSPELYWADSERGRELGRRITSGEVFEYLVPTIQARDEALSDWLVFESPTRRVYSVTVSPESQHNPNGVFRPGEEELVTQFLLAKDRAETQWDFIPKPLHGASSMRKVVILWDGVWLNLTRSVAALTLIGLTLYGSYRVARWEHRAIWSQGSRCMRCGYSLIGLAGGVCPECGHDRGAVA